MTEYRWYFGCGEPGEWLKFRPGTYTDSFWNAFRNSNFTMQTLYIYDEYDNLLYVASNLDVLYKRLTATIRKKFHSQSSYVYKQASNNLFEHLDYLNVKRSPKFNEAVEMVEQAIVEKAKRLKRAA